ncbi:MULTISPECIES: hypothetical protein [unclassified Paenibacillus]|uniref:hypothetical protein n=1 Tax=unclassified Paenibacillus TaxID=185978 RepID=UPI0027812379|nr:MULTISPECIES: hypothetical protein [unclassified Paenibacillus]MDQ0896382.1 hypothetical protein [Paenibacillus sp. V4I7]MDQ0914074.1 hypothetical protein [Paenibacillus sp. V4I5]
MFNHFLLASTSDDAINKTVEHYVLLSLSVGQKWGVLATVMAALMLWGISHIFKVRKNVKMKQTFNFWSIGMGFLAVVFTIAPYFVMHFMEQK